MNICTSHDYDTKCIGNTFTEESELLKDFFNDPCMDVEVYIAEHIQEKK